MDFSFLCIDVLTIPFASLFALGTLLAGTVGRPFGLVCGLAALSVCLNLWLLWLSWVADSWLWEKAIPAVGICVTLVGLPIAWYRHRQTVPPNNPDLTT